MWLYIPNVGEAHPHYEPHQSVVGGVFQQRGHPAARLHAEYNVEKAEDRKRIPVHLKARTKTVAYDRIRLRLDKRKNFPRRLSALTEAVCSLKPSISSRSRFRRRHRQAVVIETTAPLQGYKSVMIFAKIKQKNTRTRYSP